MAITIDVLGEPWTAETIHFPPDEDGPVVATLVCRRSERPTGRAVLQVHGFSDYFFQTDYAQWWLDRGYDFIARMRSRMFEKPEEACPLLPPDLRARFD